MPNLDNILSMLGGDGQPGATRTPGNQMPGSFEGFLAQLGVDPQTLDNETRMRLWGMWMEQRMRQVQQQQQPFQSPAPGQGGRQRR